MEPGEMYLGCSFLLPSPPYHLSLHTISVAENLIFPSEHLPQFSVDLSDSEITSALGSLGITPGDSSPFIYTPGLFKTFSLDTCCKASSIFLVSTA